MTNQKTFLGIAALVAAQFGAVAGCESSDGGGSGGGPSGGGPAAGGTHCGGTGSGGGPASGGSGGSVPTCENFDPNAGDCGSCEESLEDFCESPNNGCDLPDDLVCQTQLPTTMLYEGCGYARKESWGDVGDSWTYVWSKATGELAFYTSSWSDSDRCLPSLIVGEMPDCDDWEEACDGFGGGGAGGEGGEGGGSP